MSLRDQLLDLDETATQISRGINAVSLMSMGLDRTRDPCMDGFDAICDYLADASRTLQDQIDACLKAV